LTGKAVVDRIYTNLAIIDVTSEGLVVRKIAPGLDFEAVQEKTAAILTDGRTAEFSERSVEQTASSL
jgi:3-oxoadipate CoA-transferase beta subunit